MAFLAMEEAFEMVRQLREPLEAISRRDGDLANQLRRAAASVPLNLAEAGRRVGRDRFHQFRLDARTLVLLSELPESWPKSPETTCCALRLPLGRPDSACVTWYHPVPSGSARPFT
jgi:hypothetical protein